MQLLFHGMEVVVKELSKANKEGKRLV